MFCFFFILGEIGIFEEGEDINIVTFPPTPYKSCPIEEPLTCGISTQILPLSRLSLSSNNNSTPSHSSSSSPHDSSSSNDKKKRIGKNRKSTSEERTPKTSKKHKENTEVEMPPANGTHEKLTVENGNETNFHDASVSSLIVPNNTLSSNASITSVVTTTSPAGTVTESPQLSATTPNGKKISPVRDKLDKLKKSLTDPLLHYFQISPECEEEPDLLNTPRSLAPPHLSTLNTITVSTIETQRLGFIATEVDEISLGKICPVPKQLFTNTYKKDEDNQITNNSNNKVILGGSEKENNGEDNDENLPTPPPTPPPPIITDM